MPGPVTITVYATEQDARLGDIRKIIRDFVSLYQRYKPDIKLVFVDPSKDTEKARAAQVRFNGEMVIEYAGRSEHLTKINEQTLTSTLAAPGTYPRPNRDVSGRARRTQTGWHRQFRSGFAVRRQARTERLPPRTALIWRWRRKCRAMSACW